MKGHQKNLLYSPKQVKQEYVFKKILLIDLNVIANAILIIGLMIIGI